MSSLDAAMIGNKVAAIILMAILGIIGAIVPIYMKKMQMTTSMLLANAFAGGAFLGLGLFHILPEAINDLNSAGFVLKIGGEEYSLVFVFTFLGYVTILICEFIIVDSHTMTKEEFLQIPIKHPVSEGSELGDVRAAVCVNGEMGEALEEGRAVPDYEASVEMNADTAASNSTTGTIKPEGESNQLGINRDSWMYALKSGAILLMIALAIHGFFEGVVVGTNTELPSMWMTTVVILGHKWAESFALVTQFLNADLPRRIMIYLIATFVASSPIGVVVGLLISDSTLCSGIFNALGAGTVIFVAGEITTSVFTETKRRIVAFLFYIFGSCLVFGLTLIEMAFGS